MYSSLIFFSLFTFISCRGKMGSSPTPPIPSTISAGVVKPRGPLFINRGSLVPPGRFPHMAAIAFSNSSSPSTSDWKCGGTILNPQFILTAAHCLHDQRNATHVKVGVEKLNDTKNGQVLEIEERIKHPNYTSSNYHHDIALIKLKTSIKGNLPTEPACLYANMENKFEEVTAIGWGYTDLNNYKASNELLEDKVDVLDYDICKNNSSLGPEHQLCTGTNITHHHRHNKATCMGDSGGPLQIKHVGADKNCKWDIVGVISYGSSCSGTAGLDVRVSHYVEWIKNETAKYNTTVLTVS